MKLAEKDVVESIMKVIRDTLLDSVDVEKDLEEINEVAAWVSDRAEAVEKEAVMCDEDTAAQNVMTTVLCHYIGEQAESRLLPFFIKGMVGSAMVTSYWLGWKRAKEEKEGRGEEKDGETNNPTG